jgi:hypothetical protein
VHQVTVKFDDFGQRVEIPAEQGTPAGFQTVCGRRDAGLLQWAGGAS